MTWTNQKARRGKTYEEIYGKEKAKEIKTKQSESGMEKHKGDKNGHWVERENRYCACGCGSTFICKATSKRKYMLGHGSKGKVSERKGKTYLEIYGSEEKAKQIRSKNSKSHSGKTWEEIFGVERTKELKLLMSEQHKGVTWGHHTEESKKKSSASNKKYWKEHPRVGELNSFFGKTHTEKNKEIYRKAMIKRMSEGLMPKSFTKPHIALKTELVENKINTISEYPFKWGCIDEAIPELKIAIYVDGDYWHNLPNSKRIDNSHNTYLKNKGWKVLRFCEHEIYDDINKCVEMIRNEI